MIYYKGKLEETWVMQIDIGVLRARVCVCSKKHVTSYSYVIFFKNSGTQIL